MKFQLMKLRALLKEENKKVICKEELIGKKVETIIGLI